MAYVSLYRKYRPQTFEDVVGQEHVTTTLRNAIKDGRVASGYLFTGTRGTAKTTCARIVAKALNCIGPDGTLTSPTPDPCGVCGPCKSIAASSFVDVLEMDAASHGKVDDVRDLVASIKFPPMEGRYKVYIIDEAHQLSRDAMDAFLKTLEEPPERVVFVLATTELDKLPITIASRCQVYEFKRGSVSQIASRLSDVLKTEKVAAEPAAITLIARAADGSYRDSLSLLEQVLAYERKHITAKDVTTVLGTIDEDLLAQVVGLVADSDAAAAFSLAGSVLESGKDVRQFLRSLAERFRDMLFVGVGARPAVAGELDDSETLRSQAARFTPDSLLHGLEVLTAAEQETKRSNQHRLILEMALLRLMRLPSAIRASEETQPTNKIAPLSQREEKNAEINEVPVTGVPQRSNGAAALPEDEEIGPDTLLPGDVDLDSLPLDEEEDSEAPSAIIVSPEEYEQAEDLLQVQQVVLPEPSVPQLPLVLPPDSPPELALLQKSWQEVVNRMSVRPATAAFLREGKPVMLNGNAVVLRFDNQAAVDKVEGNERGRHLLEEAINKTLGVESGTYRVKAIRYGDILPARSGPSKVAQGIALEPRRPAVVASDAPGPFVDEVIAVFGGRLLDDDDVKG